MTIFHLADSVTVTSGATTPVKVVDLGAAMGTLPTNYAYTQTYQCEVNGTGSTCTATFQPVGSFDAAAALPPNGTGGAWNNIGSAVTITCSTPGIAPAVTTISTAVPFQRVGMVVSAISGTGAFATAVVNA